VYYTNSQPEKSREVRYYSGGRHGRRSRSSRTKLIALLGIGLVVETVVLLVSYVRMSVAESENLDLVLAERKQTQELQALRPRIEKLQSDIDMLTRARLPDLAPLEFDKVIAVDKDYVKNVVFTLSGKGSQKAYEYKVVMHNGSLNLVHPQADILFFDDLGIQVGISRLGVQKDGTPTLEMMDRGEIRSFSSKLELIEDVTPKYFRLKIYK
jgi:hypothetical protein